MDFRTKVEMLRLKLHEFINRYGVSSIETRKISDQMDVLLNQNEKYIHYPNDSEMIKFYDNSYTHLKNLIKDINQIPKASLWNNYARINNCLNHISMEYISELNWFYLCKKIKSELTEHDQKENF